MHEATTLHGREKEQEALDRLFSDVRYERCGALMIRGEPGIGKTALLDDVRERSRGRPLDPSGWLGV